jgi:hypothetical protein
MNSCVPGTVFLFDKCLMKMDRLLGGAQKCAAHRLHRLTHERPARTTNPIAPTGRWYGDSGKACANVTGNSAQADGPYPSWALGLDCTEAATSRSGQTSPGHPAAAMGQA